MIGLELPEYESRGALFCPDGKGGWLLQARLKRLVRRTRWLKLAVLDLQGKVAYSEVDSTLGSTPSLLIPDRGPEENTSEPLLATDDSMLIMALRSLLDEADIPYRLRNEGPQNQIASGYPGLGMGLSFTASPVEIFVDSHWRSAAEVILAELQSATDDPVPEVDDEDSE
jgi:hypothetical protein